MLNEWLLNNIHVIWLVLVLTKEKFQSFLHRNLCRIKKVSCVMFFLMLFLVSSTRSAGRTGIKEVNRFCSEKNHNFRGVFTPQNNRAHYTESGLRFIVPLVKVQPFIKVITTLEQNSPNPFRSNTVNSGLMDAMASILPFVTYNYSLASIGSDKTGKYWTVLNIR